MRKHIFGILILIFGFGGFLLASEVYNFLFSNSLKFKVNPKRADMLQCQQMHPKQDFKTLRILVISGGGVAGLIPLSYLQYLEAKTKKPVHELFDLFVGTSTGSIIISLLNAENEKGQIMSAAQLYQNYIHFSQDVLYASNWRKIMTLGGLIGPKYDVNHLYQSFEQHGSGNLKFYQLKNHVAIIDYLVENLSLTILKSWDCQKLRAYATLPQILAGATAAPLMFSPVIFELPNGKQGTYIDGAVIANRPSLQAIHLVRQYFPSVERIIIMSLGTGRDGLLEYHLDKKPLQYWGLLQWLEPLTRIFYSSQSFEVIEGMKDIISFVPKGKIKYYYFNSNKNVSPFDSSAKNLNKIVAAGERSVQRHQTKLDEVASLLLAKDGLSSSQ